MRETIIVNNKKYSVLFMYEERNGTKYIYYTDNTFDNEGKLNVVVGLYEEYNDDYKVSDITDELTMNKATKILNNVFRSLKDK